MLIWHVNTSRLSQITRQITEKSQIYKFLLCFLRIKKLLIKFNSNIIYFVFLNKPKKSDKKAVFKKNLWYNYIEWGSTKNCNVKRFSLLLDKTIFCSITLIDLIIKKFITLLHFFATSDKWVFLTS